MQGRYGRHCVLSPADGWQTFGEAVGAESLDAWQEQAERVLGEDKVRVLSFTVIEGVRYFVPLLPLDAVSFGITPQTLQSGRAIDKREIQELRRIIDESPAYGVRATV